MEYSKQIDFDSIMVADSALYSEGNLKLMVNMKWISRVPLSIKKAKNLVKAPIFTYCYKFCLSPVHLLNIQAIVTPTNT